LFIAGPGVSIGLSAPTFSSVNSLVAPAVSIQMAPP
jgi:hypothetical protein